METTAELESPTDEASAETEESVKEVAEETEEKPKGSILRRSYEFFFPKIDKHEEEPDSKPVKAKTDSGEDIDEEGETELSEEESDQDKELNRRNLIRQGVHMFAKPMFENIDGKINKVNQTVDQFLGQPPHRLHLVRWVFVAETVETGHQSGRGHDR